MSQTGQYTSVGSSTLATLTGNSGGAVSPTAGNIDIVGDGTIIDVVGNPGTSTLTISLGGTIPSSFPTDSGTAVPAAGALTVGGGTNMNTSGAGSTVTINLDSVVALTTLTIVNPLDVPSGGTGLSSITDHSVIVGSGVGVVTELGVATDGQLIIGATGADPVLAELSAGSNISVVNGVGAITLSVSGTTDHTLQLGNAGGSLTSLGVATNGQLPIGSTGVDPVLSTLTASTGITVTNGAGSISIGTTGGGISWNEVVGTSQAMLVNNAYIANNAGLVTLTLPATAAVGDVMRIVGKGAGQWLMAQNAGQTTNIISASTTTGVGGSLASTQQYDTIEIVCITADTDFVVISSMGNITVV